MLRTTDHQPETMRMDDVGLQAHDIHNSTQKQTSLKHDQNVFAGSGQKRKRMMSLIIMAMLCVHASLAMKVAGTTPEVARTADSGEAPEATHEHKAATRGKNAGRQRSLRQGQWP